MLAGRCLAYGEGTTYRALADIVRGLGGDPRRRVEELLDGDEQAIRGILGAIGLSDEPAQAEETAWALRRLLERARPRPARSSSPSRTSTGPSPRCWTCSTTSSRCPAASPILLVCLTRPELLEPRPAWAAPQPNRTVLAARRARPTRDARELARAPRRRRAGGADRGARRGQPAVRRAARRGRRRARTTASCRRASTPCSRPASTASTRPSGCCCSAPPSRGARFTPARWRRCCRRSERRAIAGDARGARAQGPDRRRPPGVRRRGRVSLHARADPRRRLRGPAEARARRAARGRRRLARARVRRPPTRSSATTSSRPACCAAELGHAGERERDAGRRAPSSASQAASRGALAPRRPGRRQRAARARARARRGRRRAARARAAAGARRVAASSRGHDRGHARARRGDRRGARPAGARRARRSSASSCASRPRRTCATERAAPRRRRGPAGARARGRRRRAVPRVVAARAGGMDRRAGRSAPTRRGARRRRLRAPGGRRARAVRRARLARDRGRVRADAGRRGDRAAARSSATSSRASPVALAWMLNPLASLHAMQRRLRARGALPARGQRDARTSSAACGASVSHHEALVRLLAGQPAARRSGAARRTSRRSQSMGDGSAAGDDERDARAGRLRAGPAGRGAASCASDRGRCRRPTTSSPQVIWRGVQAKVLGARRALRAGRGARARGRRARRADRLALTPRRCDARPRRGAATCAATRMSQTAALAAGLALYEAKGTPQRRCARAIAARQPSWRRVTCTVRTFNRTSTGDDRAGVELHLAGSRRPRAMRALVAASAT